MNWVSYYPFHTVCWGRVLIMILPLLQWCVLAQTQHSVTNPSPVTSLRRSLRRAAQLICTSVPDCAVLAKVYIPCIWWSPQTGSSLLQLSLPILYDWGSHLSLLLVSYWRVQPSYFDAVVPSELMAIYHQTLLKIWGMRDYIVLEGWTCVKYGFSYTVSGLQRSSILHRRPMAQSLRPHDMHSAWSHVRARFVALFSIAIIDIPWSDTCPSFPSVHPHSLLPDRKSTRLNSSHVRTSRMPSSAWKKKKKKQTKKKKKKREKKQTW